MDVMPFFHEKFHHLAFRLWWWKTLSQVPLMERFQCPQKFYESHFEFALGY
jgi:hypothetical protein